MEEFQRAVKDAIGIGLSPRSWEDLKYQPKEVVDPFYISAIGAAQLTKDFMDAPVPWGCYETGECMRERERIYRESFIGKHKRMASKQEL